jgi:ribosome-binding ATPase YchF (GTP1/OBG family)
MIDTITFSSFKRFKDLYKRLQDYIMTGKDVRAGNWTIQEVEIINPLYLLTAKPKVVLVNVSEDDYVSQSTSWMEKIKDWVSENTPNSEVILFCGEFEEMVCSLFAHSIIIIIVVAIKSISRYSKYYCYSTTLESFLPACIS